MSMSREQLLKHIARCVTAHCERDEAHLIAQMMTKHPARMVAMLATRGGTRFTDSQFAAFCLQCAKRVKAGPTA